MMMDESMMRWAADSETKTPRRALLAAISRLRCISPGLGGLLPASDFLLPTSYFLLPASCFQESSMRTTARVVCRHTRASPVGPRAPGTQRHPEAPRTPSAPRPRPARPYIPGGGVRPSSRKGGGGGGGSSRGVWSDVRDEALDQPYTIAYAVSAHAAHPTSLRPARAARRRVMASGWRFADAAAHAYVCGRLYV